MAGQCILAAGIVTSVWAAGVGVRLDMGAMQAEIRLHRVAVVQVMPGQALTVETAAVTRSPGPQAHDLHRGVPPSQRTCAEGEVVDDSLASFRGKHVRLKGEKSAANVIPVQTFFFFAARKVSPRYFQSYFYSSRNKVRSG